MIVEIGGTVGDIEIVPFIEAIRQFRRDVGRDNVCYVHLTLVPYLAPSGEQKTKPTQHSVTELRSRGIQPDVIVCRSDQPISEGLKRKISLLCDVPIEAVISAVDAPSIYEIPLVLHEEGLDDYVCRTLGIDDAAHPIDLSEWEALVRRVESLDRRRAVGHHRQVRQHARRLPVGGRGAAPRRLRTTAPRWSSTGSTPSWCPGCSPPTASASSTASSSPAASASGASRAWSPPPATPATTTSRASACASGLQVMVIEVARDLAGLDGANSREFDCALAAPGHRPDARPGRGDRQGRHHAPRLLPGHAAARLQGGSGLRDRWPSPSATATATSSTPATGPSSRRPGWSARGRRPTGGWSSSSSWPDHPFWVGTQAHPEFKSRPDRPHPLFHGLVAAALERAEGREPHLLDLDAVT